MTNFSSSDHPRVDNGTFTNKSQSAPESSVALAPRPHFGQFPVNLEGFPPVDNYRFQASALVEGAGGISPYFTEIEMRRVIEPINAAELESGDPELIVSTPEGFAVSSNGALHLLPRIDTPTGPIFATGLDNGREWELTEGEWFDDGGTEHNFTEVHTERSEAAGGDTFDRAWTVRRSDGKYVTRTTTFFVEAYEDDPSETENLLFERDEAVGEAVTTYSVFSRTEDSIADSFHGDREVMEDPSNEDSLVTDKVFDTVSRAEECARARAESAEAGFNVAGWDGYPA